MSKPYCSERIGFAPKLLVAFEPKAQQAQHETVFPWGCKPIKFVKITNHKFAAKPKSAPHVLKFGLPHVFLPRSHHIFFRPIPAVNVPKAFSARLERLWLSWRYPRTSLWSQAMTVSLVMSVRSTLEVEEKFMRYAPAFSQY
jgi:hypothetical protein